MNFDPTDLPVIDQGDYKPIYAQLSEALLKYIQVKGLMSGDPLPSESDLVKHYGISRMTVRFAIQRLATQGLIKKKKGVGTFVAEKPITGNIHGVRSIEENLKAQGFEVENFLLEGGITEHAIELWTAELRLPPASRLFKIRLLKKIDRKPFAIEVRFIPIDTANLFSIDQLTTRPLIELFNSKVETKVWRVAYRTRSEPLLERYTSDLGVDAGSAGLVQFGTYYNSNDDPVMTGKHIILGEKMELRYEFNFQEASQLNGQNIPEVTPLVLSGTIQ